MTEIFRGFMLTAEVIMKPKVTINYVRFLFDRALSICMQVVGVSHSCPIPDLDDACLPLSLGSTIFDNGGNGC